jgi:hypothetical protein
MALKVAQVEVWSTVTPPQPSPIITVDTDDWLPQSAIPPDDYLFGGIWWSHPPNDLEPIYVPVTSHTTLHDRIAVGKRLWVCEKRLTYLVPEKKNVS